MQENKNDIIFYEDEKGEFRIDVLHSNEDVWLTQKSMSKLFNVEENNITYHLKNIYSNEEIEKNPTTQKIRVVQNEGNRKVNRNVDFYSLDAIIAVGYRVNSKEATKFRKWATKILKDYMIQGFALNDERFMQGKKGDQEYFKRLLERIKLIRTSERMFYQKITDIFAECSIDYDKNSEIARDFYATIQNKFHYAITKNTAAEIIYHRVDSKKDNMGLTNWTKSPDGKILKSDLLIAKNYLSEAEIKGLNNLVNVFLDVAEMKAEEETIMKMVDWESQVTKSLLLLDKEILSDKGAISAELAKEKAEIEYDKYKVIQDTKYLSDFDKLIQKTELIDDKK